MILNDNSTQQINTLVIQLRNKITNLTNEFRKLNNNINDLDSEISDLERRVSSNENDADNNIDGLDSKISDLEKRVSSNENNAAAMNAEISANTEAISGKADKIHTHTKSDITDFPTSLKNPNALTINGKTYDGSSAVDAGVQTVANGGTGVTTQADINKAFIGDLEVGSSDVTDSTEFVSSYASNNGFSEPGYVNTPLRRKFSAVWNYIKGKADSIYAALSHTHTKSEITDFPTSLPANGGTADNAYLIEPNFTRVDITEVTSYTTKYIKLAYCNWYDAGTLQVYLSGNYFEDTLVINFGGGNALHPMLCGHYNGNSHRVYSVIAQKGSDWNLGYSIYVKVGQETNLTVDIALLRGSCTFDISESTTAPTNISEWPVNYGLFGNITAPNITSLEQRVAALESKA